jgi:hypothetical protein
MQPQEEYKGGKGDICPHLAKGNCLMVRCKDKHMFLGIDIKLKNTLNIVQKGV